METEKILEVLKKDGFYILDSFFNESEVTKIKNELLTIYNGMPDYSALYDKTTTELDAYPYGKHLRFSDLNMIPEFKNIFLSKNFTPITKGYLGPKCSENLQIFSTYEYVNSDNSSIKPRNSYWHFDPYHSLKYFIYLEDTTIENGCLRLIPGTIKDTAEIRRQMSFQEITGEGYKVEHLIYDRLDTVINLEAKAGSVIIFDTDLFHVGSNLLSNNSSRMVIIVHNRP